MMQDETHLNNSKFDSFHCEYRPENNKKHGSKTFKLFLINFNNYIIIYSNLFVMFCQDKMFLKS